MDYDVYGMPRGRRSGEMPKTVNVHEAKTRLSMSLDRVSQVTTDPQSLANL